MSMKCAAAAAAAAAVDSRAAYGAGTQQKEGSNDTTSLAIAFTGSRAAYGAGAQQEDRSSRRAVITWPRLHLRLIKQQSCVRRDAAGHGAGRGQASGSAGKC
eukprot:209678-Pelagomonas_calceolata.AAC.2